MAKWKLFTIFQDVWKHGLRSKYIKNITESSAVSNWLKGTTGSGLTNAEVQQNAWNSQEAAINRDWQEQMDATKYQRQTQDMVAAGLNPAMLYGGTSSPSALSGSAASGGDAGSPSAGMLDSVLNIMFAKQRMKNLKAEERNITEDADLKEANTNLVKQNELLSKANTDLQNLIKDFYPKVTNKQLDEIQAKIDALASEVRLNDSNVTLNEAKTALTDMQTEIERLNKEWFPKINAAKVGADKARAVKDYADAAWQNFYTSWTKGHAGVTPGRDLWTGFAATMADSISHVVQDVQDSIGSIVEGMKSAVGSLKFW